MSLYRKPLPRTLLNTGHVKKSSMHFSLHTGRAPEGHRKGTGRKQDSRYRKGTPHTGRGMELR